jgi:hypothetical protein
MSHHAHEGSFSIDNQQTLRPIGDASIVSRSSPAVTEEVGLRVTMASQEGLLVHWPHRSSFGSGPAALSGPISKAPSFAGDTYFKLAHDRLERKYKPLYEIEGVVCTTWAPGDQEKSIDGKSEQLFEGVTRTSAQLLATRTDRLDWSGAPPRPKRLNPLFGNGERLREGFICWLSVRTKNPMTGPSRSPILPSSINP